MSNSKRFLPLLLMIMLLTALGLAACGDSATNTPAAASTTVAASTKGATTAAATTAAATTAAATTAAATTAAATTAAATTAAATTAASTTNTTAASAGGDDTVPLYAGATVVTLPDAIKTQLESSVGSSVTNPQVATFATGDAGAKVKSFYTDYLAKNGWTDLTASAGQAASTQIEALGGFFLLYSKGQKVAALIGLPGATASSLGISGTSIPTGGTLVIGFSGEASGAGSSTTATATTAASTTATTAAATTAATTATTAAAATGDSTIPLYDGATPITLPDAIKTQFESSVGSNVANPQVAAFVTKDDGAKVKAFYTDYLTKNGWKDAASAVSGNTGVSQIESAGGFYLVYSKDKQVSVLIGLPSATAAGFGVPAADIPSSGTLVLGFSGTSK